jgi:threonine/homoserine/homoserine lactone efflux protein
MEFLEGILYMMWRGLAIGVIISAPMGPVGILCVQRTLEKGRKTGFFTGVGAALSDLFYCLLTGFGLSFIEDFLKANQNAIQIIGSVVLVVFGVYLFRSNPARTLKKPEASRSSRRRDVLQGFLFTFSNPLIIFLIIGLFARFNFLLPEISLPHYIIGFTFIFLGALLWWWVVSFFIDKVRSHFNLRSMWLINKIIGCVIMVFALVGIITAVTGMASAHGREPVYMNSTRGFGLLGDSGERGAPLVIDNAGADTIIRFLPLDRAEEFSFSFRAANLHNRSGKSYPHVLRDGRTAKVSHPSWGVAVKGAGHMLEFILATADDPRDELRLTAVDVCAYIDGRPAAESRITAGISFFDGENSFRLRRDAGKYTLLGGDRQYHPILSVDAPDLQPDSVGFIVAPGAALSLDHMTVAVTAERMPDARLEVSHFANPDVRASYFNRSTDLMEGEWEIFDRSFEDSRLRPGGEYRLAVVRSREGYNLIYISGAEKNGSSWIPGMDKGYLHTTSFRNVFDVTWLDPAGQPLDGEIKAQFGAPDILTLQFVDHASTLRLRKTKNYGKQ